MRLTGILMILSLFACSESVDKPQQKSDNTTNSTGAVSTIIDATINLGPINVAKITAYDFSQCGKGEILGQSILSNKNNVSIEVQLDNDITPVLLEMSEFNYRESANGREIVSVTQSLYGAYNIQKGQTHSVMMNYWSNLAYARSRYRCNQNSSQAAAYVTESNDMVSAMMLYDIASVQPQDLSVTPILNKSDDAIRASFANELISYFTYYLDLDLKGSGHEYLSSVSLANIAFDDLASDGILDGIGAAGGIAISGNGVTKSVNADFYRAEIPSEIYFVIAKFNPVPENQQGFISVMAESINSGQVVDFYPATQFAALDTEIGPTLNSVGYIDSCPRSDSCNPVGCNACWTIIGSDRYVSCEVELTFSFKTRHNFPVTISSVRDPVLFEEQTPTSAYPDLRYYVRYPYLMDNSLTDPYIGGPLVTGFRTLDFTVTGDIGNSKNLKINIDSRVYDPGHAMWYNMPYRCDISVAQ